MVTKRQKIQSNPPKARVRLLQPIPIDKLKEKLRRGEISYITFRNECRRAEQEV